MPNWMPGSSKQSVPQAPYFSPAPRPRLSATKSQSDLRRVEEQPEQEAASELPYVGRRPQNPPPVPPVPQRYASARPLSDELTQAGSESDNSSISSQAPQNPRPRMGRLANVGSPVLAATPPLPSPDSGKRTQMTYPAPRAPAPDLPLPPLPSGPQLSIFDLRYHTSPIEGQEGMFQVEMRYKVRVATPARRQ